MLTVRRKSVFLRGSENRWNRGCYRNLQRLQTLTFCYNRPGGGFDGVRRRSIRGRSPTTDVPVARSSVSHPQLKTPRKPRHAGLGGRETAKPPRTVRTALRAVSRPRCAWFERTPFFRHLRRPEVFRRVVEVPKALRDPERASSLGRLRPLRGLQCLPRPPSSSVPPLSIPPIADAD